MVGLAKRGAKNRRWRARYCKPIMGVWGRAPQWGSGAELLARGAKYHAESLLIFGRPVEAANLLQSQ